MHLRSSGKLSILFLRTFSLRHQSKFCIFGGESLPAARVSTLKLVTHRPTLVLSIATADRVVTRMNLLKLRLVASSARTLTTFTSVLVSMPNLINSSALSIDQMPLELRVAYAVTTREASVEAWAHICNPRIGIKLELRLWQCQ